MSAPTTKAQKTFIINKIHDLDLEERTHILQIIMQQHKSKIQECADGCRINLDALSGEFVNKLYHIINIKLTPQI